MSSLPSDLMRKSALIQKPSGQIPKAFNQHGLAEKGKNYVGMIALIQPFL